MDESSQGIYTLHGNEYNILPYPDLNEIFFLHPHEEKQVINFNIQNNQHRRIYKSKPPYTSLGPVKHLRLGNVVWVFAQELRSLLKGHSIHGI